MGESHGFYKEKMSERRVTHCLGYSLDNSQQSLHIQPYSEPQPMFPHSPTDSFANSFIRPTLPLRAVIRKANNFL